MVAEWCLIATEVKELDTEGNLRKPLLPFPWEYYSFLWLETNLGGKLLSKRWSLFHSIRTGKRGYVMVAPSLWPTPSCQWPLRQGGGGPFWALVKTAGKNLEGKKFYLFIKSLQHTVFTTNLLGTQKVSINTGLFLNESSVCCLTKQRHKNWRGSWYHQLAVYLP